MNKLFSLLFLAILCGGCASQRCNHLLQGAGTPVSAPQVDSYEYIDTSTGVRFYWNFKTESWE